MKQYNDYNNIAADVAATYQECHNLAQVAKRYHIAIKTASMLCRQQGVEVKCHNKHGRPVEAPKDTDTCYYCRAYSKTGILDGYCLTHRRMTKSTAKEPCFK